MRISWAAYFIPFMFAYSPLLILRGDPVAIVLTLTVTLLGIFMGTLAVVGFFQARIPWPFRVAYGMAAVLLLVQPAMFSAAVWLNLMGVVAAALAIWREVQRGRSVSRPPVGEPAISP